MLLLIYVLIPLYFKDSSLYKLTNTIVTLYKLTNTIVTNSNTNNLVL